MKRALIRQIEWALLDTYNRSFHDPARLIMAESTKDHLNAEMNAHLNASPQYTKPFEARVSLDGTQLLCPPYSMSHMLNPTTGRMVRIECDDTAGRQIYYQLDSDPMGMRHLLMEAPEV